MGAHSLFFFNTYMNPSYLKFLGNRIFHNLLI